MTQPVDIKAFLLKAIPKHPKDVVAITLEHFQVSRMTVTRHLSALIEQGKVFKSGGTKNTTYYLTTERNRCHTYKLTKNLKEDIVWEKDLAPLFRALPNHINTLLQYGFTEVFNNAIDHSQGTKITVELTWVKDTIQLKISDNGIGVFQRISNIFHFQDMRECLLHLTKGKLTTDPINHSGEGIFFTSRAFDSFILVANGISFFRNNLLHDWSVSSMPTSKGTQVLLTLSSHSKTNLITVFNQYTSEEDLAFTKTELLVDLSQLKNEYLISRSQAKRILMNIEPFTCVTLDFSKVKTVGQGFVDEIFRVYKLKNPNVTIQYINANDDVQFMIKRGLKY